KYFMFRRLTVLFFTSRRRHTRFSRDWSSDVCSSDLPKPVGVPPAFFFLHRARKGKERRRLSPALFETIGTPTGIRTRVSWLRTMHPRPLDDGGLSGGFPSAVRP